MKKHIAFLIAISGMVGSAIAQSDAPRPDAPAVAAERGESSNQSDAPRPSRVQREPARRIQRAPNSPEQEFSRRERNERNEPDVQGRPEQHPDRPRARQPENERQIENRRPQGDRPPESFRPTSDDNRRERSPEPGERRPNRDDRQMRPPQNGGMNPPRRNQSEGPMRPDQNRGDVFRDPQMGAPRPMQGDQGRPRTPGPRMYAQENNGGPRLDHGPFHPEHQVGPGPRVRRDNDWQGPGMNRPAPPQAGRPGRDGRQMRQPGPRHQEMPQLSEAKREKLRRKFNQADQDGDGFISKQEFVRAFQAKSAGKNKADRKDGFPGR